MSIFEKSVREFKCSLRLENCLGTLGIKTIGDILPKTEREILRTKNLGKTTLNELKDILSEYGLVIKKNNGDSTNEYRKLNSIYCLQPIGENKYRVLNRYYSKFGSSIADEKEQAEVVEIPNIEHLISPNAWIHFYQEPLKSENYESYQHTVRSFGLEKYLSEDLKYYQ